jgi:CHAT domain
MRQSYLDVVVYISPAEGGGFAVRATSDEGGQGHSTLTLPFRLRDLASAIFGVAETARAIGTVTPEGGLATTDTPTAEDFGAALFEALFQGRVNDVLVATETKARNSIDTGVRIRLSMDLAAPGMAEVASLPWELMGRRGERPLVVSVLTPLVRSLDIPGSTDPQPFRPPLRILALMSNPGDTARLDLDRERQMIEASWAKLPSVEVDYVRPTRADLRSALRAKTYHVVHFMGHGDYDAGAGGLLLFQTEDGSGDRVTGEDFSLMLADSPIRLVFLNACKTATTGARAVHPFAGVATALLKDRVPAVVAMQFPISDDAAIQFSQEFYQSIAQGYSVDAAVAEGRKVLRASRQAEWATPVLYLRSRDGRLFESAIDSPPPLAPAPSASSAALAASPASPTPAPPAQDDPWGAGGSDVLRVFLATPDQNLASPHRRLAKALRERDDVRVVDSVPLDDRAEHDEAVDRLVRGADLCVHLLGASPGQRLDWADPDEALSTYPLEQLRQGLKIARAQLVIVTSEDKTSLSDDDPYGAEIAELISLPRDRSRFEFQVVDRLRIEESVLARLEAVRAERRAGVAQSGVDGLERKAFVDAHDIDAEPAYALTEYLLEHDISASVSAVAAEDLGPLDEAVQTSNLYVLVAGKVDKAWVKNRQIAILKAAARARATLLVAKYAVSDDADGGGAFTKSRFEISALRVSDRRWVDDLFAEPGPKT